MLVKPSFLQVVPGLIAAFALIVKKARTAAIRTIDAFFCIGKGYFYILDLYAIPANMGDEPRADISAKWEFERFEGLITRNPHRPQTQVFPRSLSKIWM